MNHVLKITFLKMLMLRKNIDLLSVVPSLIGRPQHTHTQLIAALSVREPQFQPNRSLASSCSKRVSVGCRSEISQRKRSLTFHRCQTPKTRSAGEFDRLLRPSRRFTRIKCCLLTEKKRAGKCYHETTAEMRTVFKKQNTRLEYHDRERHGRFVEDFCSFKLWLF